MTQRYAEIDWIKVVGIFAVVLIHCLRPLWNPNASPAEHFLNHALRFAVPGFLFCSGFLYAHTRALDWKITLARFRRIVLPYLVASGAAEVYLAVQRRPQDAGQILEDLLTGSAFGHYYYVFVIITLVIATPLIAWLSPRIIALVTVLLIGLQLHATAADALGFASVERAGSNFWTFRSPALWWNYFLLGWLARVHEEKLRAYVIQRRHTIASGLAIACVLLAATRFLDLPAFVVAVASWLQVFFVVGLIGALACGRERVHPVVVRLSEATYAIYLFHLFFLLPVQPYFPHTRGALDPSVLLAQFVPGIVGSLLLIALARRALGERSRLLLGA